MSKSQHIDLPEDTKSWLSTNGMIIGLLLGGALIYWAGGAWLDGTHLIHTAVSETFWVAVYLTMVVAFCAFKMPVFAYKSPFWSTFWLVMFAGHISLFFDSFAVILLLATGIFFIKTGDTKDSYNQFFVKAVSAFTALTVGGGFYLGELWGLPWFITNGLDNPLAGLPILLVVTPYCIFLALLTAKTHPVRMEKVVMDGTQIKAGLEFTVALLLIVLTHSPFLCIGALFLYSALRGETVKLVESTMHELSDGAENALGLILLAVIFQEAGLVEFIQPWLQGSGMFFGAAISSPFAGAMAPPAANLHDFYVGLSMLMSGAPLFVFSSLVAIVVFKDNLQFEELPNYMKFPAALLGGRKRGHIQEGVAYTLLMLPMVLGLVVLLYIGNATGIFVSAAELLGVHMPVA